MGKAFRLVLASTSFVLRFQENYGISPVKSTNFVLERATNLTIKISANDLKAKFKNIFSSFAPHILQIHKERNYQSIDSFTKNKLIRAPRYELRTFSHFDWAYSVIFLKTKYEARTFRYEARTLA